MPCWYYDKKDLKLTPSIKDGISFETERRYRKEGARFIMECGTAMSLGHNTMATGVVYFHRFYMFHSFKTFPRYVTACCCLLLAGKVEETPKKCRDIIKTARSSLNDDQFYSFGDDPKEEVMTLERILLQTIKFDLQVEHPYGFLVKYAKCFKGDQNKLQKIVQMAWNFVNDSLSTTVCLQWEPEIIAVALIHLATKLSKFSVTDWEGKQPNHQRWWDMFVADVTMEILEDICHQVLDLYQQPNNRETPSPPQKPPSKASPPPVKRPTTPPSSSSKTSPLPLQPAAVTKIQQDDISDNSTPSKIFPIESVPPTRMYPPNYGNIYPTHPSSSYGGMPPGGPAPPPPQPPLYGQQYAPPPQVTSHYAGSSMASTSHHSAPSHPSSHYSSSSAHHQNLPPHHQQPPLPSHHGVSTGHNPIPPGHHGTPQSHHTLSGAHHPPTYYTSAAPHNRNYYPP